MTKTALLAAVLCCAAAASTSARLECGGGLVAVCGAARPPADCHPAPSNSAALASSAASSQPAGEDSRAVNEISRRLHSLLVCKLLHLLGVCPFYKRHYG